MMTADLEARVGNRSRRLTEFALALAILSLGIQLNLAPAQVFKPGGALEPLMLISPRLWTSFFVCLGSVRVIVIIVNGVWPLSPTVRWVLSMLSLFVWLSITVGYWMMLPATAGFPALVLAPIAFFVESLCLFALSALRAGQASGA